MGIKTYQTYHFGDIAIDYLQDEESGLMGLRLYPVHLESKLVEHRADLSESPDAKTCSFELGKSPALQLDPLVQISVVGDHQPSGFAAGLTMRNASSTMSLRFQAQDEEVDGKTHRVVTGLKNDAGLHVKHFLVWREGESGVWLNAEVTNQSGADIVLQLISSFALGHVSPFAPDDAPERLWIHRFRSFWSVEGRHDERRVEDLELERSWLGGAQRVERFGQVGSMPVRKWFPFVSLEDRTAGVLWGAQLAWSGSWQMEVGRTTDTMSLTGGLADREFGHWMKRLAPGESFVTPSAAASCVEGRDIDDLCSRLTSMQEAAAELHPPQEHDLPIVFNEWCTTWGEPTHDKMVAIADRLEGTRTKYLVIDAGWYGNPGSNWGGAQGDWSPSKIRFPQGLRATCEAIRKRGLVPGLWFEFEALGESSKSYNSESMMLMRDGAPIQTGGRRFWDMRKREVQAHLEERVIDLLDSCGFGYIKVDYNESFGIGVDHEDSLGEGLRQSIEGTHRFFRRMRERLPDLVIENCSSGGHRLEPAMIGLSAMSSFSDCHEGLDIPIIAANAQRLLLPRQSQIWAVLTPGETLRRTVYSLAATFLGRMCISGEIWGLRDEQMDCLKEAQALYEDAVPVIKSGRSRRYGPRVLTNRYPKGWQVVVREGANGKQLLSVVHRFEENLEDIVCPIPEGQWKIAGELSEGSTGARVEECELRITGLEPFAGAVVLLETD